MDDNKDIDWYCKLFGLKLYWYQRAMIKMLYGKEIKRIRKNISNLSCLNKKEDNQDEK